MAVDTTLIMTDKTVPMSLGGVYVITTPSGKQYVGSAHNFTKRWSRHRKDLEKGIHHSPGLQNSYNKYGLDGLTFNRLLVCEKKNVLFYEQLVIDAYSAETRRKLSEAQKAAGNNSGRFQKGIVPWSTGRQISEETRAKLSAFGKIRPVNPLAIERMRQSNIGRKPSEATLAKFLEKNGAGVAKSDEHKKKLADAKKANWQDPVYRANMLEARRVAAERRINGR